MNWVLNCHNKFATTYYGIMFQMSIMWGRGGLNILMEVLRETIFLNLRSSQFTRMTG